MRLRGVRQSRNVEDRRGRRAGGAAGLGGAGLLVVLAIAYFTGIDVTPLLQEQPGTQRGGPVELSAGEEEAGVFAAQVLATTEDVWTEIFAEEFGMAYEPPQLVLFSEVTQSGCGGASGSSGPFYCPADERAYLDTAFFAFMAERLGARGDFAAAYVIAHEVAHHVQHELGILGQANQARAAMSQADSNRVSVMIELQADCLSGVWASRLDGILEPGDIEEAIGTAEVIGDDYLQARAGRQPNPHGFTHGTS
ncbi:KPN_02809 family neutral zinc metallopeptidase, partial [Roseicyclus sp.]|uniref:KPN_02809 family neutral zinc metallopeptidase n=1 Tax=Roseicyclus sp. TaxID=1914329 RepID=UPI003F9EDCFD